MATDGAQNQSQEMLTEVYLTTFTPPLQSLTVMDSKWMVVMKTKLDSIFSEILQKVPTSGIVEIVDFQLLLYHLATTMLREHPQAPAQGSAGLCRALQGSAGLCAGVCRGPQGSASLRAPWVERARDRFVDYGAMQLV